MMRQLHLSFCPLPGTWPITHSSASSRPRWLCVDWLSSKPVLILQSGSHSGTDIWCNPLGTTRHLSVCVRQRLKDHTRQGESTIARKEKHKLPISIVKITLFYCRAFSKSMCSQQLHCTLLKLTLVEGLWKLVDNEKPYRLPSCST